MAFTRAGLTRRLAKLDAALPSLRCEYPNDAEFWNAFAVASDFAIECATQSNYEWVNEQVDGLLRKHEITVPTDISPNDG